MESGQDEEGELVSRSNWGCYPVEAVASGRIAVNTCSQEWGEVYKLKGVYEAPIPRGALLRTGKRR